MIKGNKADNFYRRKDKVTGLNESIKESERAENVLVNEETS